jgi:hypothetical protein
MQDWSVGMRQSEINACRFSLFPTDCFVSVRVSVKSMYHPTFMYTRGTMWVFMYVSTRVYVGLCGLIRAVRA